MAPLTGSAGTSASGSAGASASGATRAVRRPDGVRPSLVMPKETVHWPACSPALTVRVKPAALSSSPSSDTAPSNWVRTWAAVRSTPSPSAV